MKTHLLHIFAKLKVNDRAAAAAYENGLLKPNSRDRDGRPVRPSLSAPGWGDGGDLRGEFGQVGE